MYPVLTIIAPLELAVVRSASSLRELVLDALYIHPTVLQQNG